MATKIELVESSGMHTSEEKGPMKVLFLHGWHSVPGGVKATFLIEHRLEVFNPALDDADFGGAVLTAKPSTTVTGPT